MSHTSCKNTTSARAPTATRVTIAIGATGATRVIRGIDVLLGVLQEHFPDDSLAGLMAISKRFFSFRRNVNENVNVTFKLCDQMVAECAPVLGIHIGWGVSLSMPAANAGDVQG